ncbi:MAG: PQQ-like beta-propeller repeat protein [Planctomycetes bacterium]|nr:PQQ-like beta-propeller repeat protein [Planctomycetota bacterium]
MWQRTATRAGNSLSVGPRSPTIRWSARIDASNSFVQLTAGPVLDSQGRVIVGHTTGVTALDAVRGEILWAFSTPDSVDSGLCLFGDRVLFGSSSDFVYCISAESGALIWRRSALPHPNLAPVVDPMGVIYYVSQTSQGGPLSARRVSDGSLVWSRNVMGSLASPALDLNGRVFSGSPVSFDWSAYRTSDSEWLWSFIMHSWASGTSAVQSASPSTVYIATSGRLYALDASTGIRLWTFAGPMITGSRIALGQQGTIYVGSGAQMPFPLYAVNASGELVWQYDANEQHGSSPICDGHGVIYFGTQATSQNTGHVHAVNPDGAGMWVAELPGRVAASPCLAPDGTLFVLASDKRLYAFRDPDRPYLDEPDPNNPTPPQAGPPRRMTPP